MLNINQQPLSPGLLAIHYHSPSEKASGATESRVESALNTSLSVQVQCYPRGSLGCTQDIIGFGKTNHIAIAGSPYWASTELQKEAERNGHAALLARLYEECGIDALKHLRGAFSFVIADSGQDKFYAGTDRLGRLPLYYTVKDSAVVVASSAAAILNILNQCTSTSEQAIYHYVYFHMIPSPDCLYEGLKKLPAAHYLAYESGDLSIKQYWIPDFSRVHKRGYEDLRANLKDALRSSVARSTQGAKKVGAFLSGGLDSSTVTGVLAELSDTTADAYSIGFDAKGYDEMAYARITARHFGVNLHEYYVTPDDVVEALPLIAASYDEPFGNSSALPAWFCAKFAAEQGVSRLLAGDGGDELFAGNDRYGSQRAFDYYGLFPEALRRAVIEPTINALPESFPLSSKAKSYIKQASTALPERLQYYNFLHRHRAQEIFSDAFLANVDTSFPLALLKHIYDRPNIASDLDRMLYMDWQITLADNDLRKVSHTAALAGVEIRYPLLDDELLELSCQIDDSLKMRGGNLRYFFKEALRGWLPEETITKKKQGFGLPFGVWMQTHAPLRDMAYETLLRLRTRKYFRPEFIDSTIQLHRDGHAAYYGELIWILVVFELWMSQNDDGFTN